MHILIDVVGEVKVHHVLHMLNVQAPGSDGRGHQDRTLPSAEVTESLLPLPLLTVSVATQDSLHLKISHVFVFG